MSKKEVIQIVQRHLQTSPLVAMEVVIIEDSVRQEGKEWYIPIRPNHQLPKKYSYYEQLTDLEDEIKEKEDLEVLLVPAA